MDFNSLIFPAPKKKDMSQGFHDALIWVPVYRKININIQREEERPLRSRVEYFQTFTENRMAIKETPGSLLRKHQMKRQPIIVSDVGPFGLMDQGSPGISSSLIMKVV